MIDWDSLQITVLDEDRGVLTETERIYSMQAEQVMVIMSGAAGPAGPRGPKGDKGDAGEAVWGAITGTLSNQTDLQDALDSKPSDAPADDKLYGRQNGVWTPISSAGVVEWGDISGTLSDQTDLQTAINGKLSDAPSDGSEYVRKNGAWAVSGGAGVWGSIAGTLSNQTDLQAELDARLKAESVAEEFDPTKSYPAGWNYVTYKGILYRFYGPYHDEWGHMTVYEAISVKSLIDQKANTADLGAMASVSDAPSDGSEYVRKNGAWAVSSGGGGGAPVWGGITGTLADQTDLNTALSAKAEASTVYTKSEADALLADKADSADLAGKADSSAVYSKTDVDTALSTKADSASVYSKTDVDTALSAKADSTAVYTKSEVDTALGAKANSADVTTSLATKADASAVYTKSEVDTALGAKANTADLGDLATKDTVDYLTEIDNIPAAFPPSAHTHDDRYYTESEVDTLLSGKQSTLTFDSTPTASSTNPVTSGGVKSALDAKVSKSGDTMTGDLIISGASKVLRFVPTDTSKMSLAQIAVRNNERLMFWHRTSGNDGNELYQLPAMDTSAKGNNYYDILTTKNIDTTPTASSANPVTSGGVKSALDAKVSKSGDTMSGKLIIDTGFNYQGIEIEGAEGAPSIHIYNTGNTVVFDLFANGSTGGERYSLPRPEVRSSDAWYSILTNKTIDDTGWLTIGKPTGATYTGTARYRRIGKLVYIELDGIANLTEGVNIGYLQTGCRPSANIFYPLVAGYNQYRQQGLIRIYTGGAVQLQFQTNDAPIAQTQFFGTYSFMVD